MKIHYNRRKVYFSKSKFKKSDVINLVNKCKDIKDKFFIDIGTISEYHNAYKPRRVNKCKEDGDFKNFDFIDEKEIKYYEF